MKKLIALLAVCGFAFAFVACGGQKAEEAATEEVAPATEEVAPATEEADSTEVVADSTAAE
ncbi:MAG: hypothetical protein KF846_08875 [Cyclobacteriaceae bacterium]|nr:hypothetical protein [Cyclobacteriaceae bacterium]MBX2956256.1 hypothetical protein [Cyclobacteriaceae bacterium]